MSSNFRIEVPLKINRKKKSNLNIRFKYGNNFNKKKLSFKNWNYKYQIAFVFLIFLSFSISFPVLFRISVFWISCLGSPQASRHALGYGGVPSFYLNNRKTNPRKKNPFNFTLFKNYSEQKKSLAKHRNRLQISIKYL